MYTTVAGNGIPITTSVIVTPTAGIHTFRVGVHRNGGTKCTLGAGPQNPTSLIVTRA